jgi:RNA exonuclease 1
MLIPGNVQFIHPWVIDTSLIYQHPRGPPFKPSLKWLAQKWLQKEIQVPRSVVDGEVVEGHDSEEDARAAVELLNAKMEKGDFLVSHLSSDRPIDA